MGVGLIGFHFSLSALDGVRERPFARRKHLLGAFVEGHFGTGGPSNDRSFSNYANGGCWWWWTVFGGCRRCDGAKGEFEIE